MRFVVFALTVPFAWVANAQTNSLVDAEMAKREAIFQRARELYPVRRDTPLRYLNITDNEVREIQRLADSIHIPELLNISPVVTGCACEEGPDCTEQVTIVGKYRDQEMEIQLSRLRNRWSIGRVQRWWIEYAALRAREPLMDPREYAKARDLRIAEFPMCPGGAAKPAASVANNSPSVVKK